MYNWSPFTTALVIVLVCCIISILCCSILSSYVGSTARAFVRRNIQPIPPLNENETISLMNSINPIIQKYINQNRNRLSQEEKIQLNNAIKSNLELNNIQVYTRIKNNIVPQITKEVNENINIVPYSIRVKLNNQVSENIISRIVDYQFSIGVNLLRGIQRGLDIINSEQNL